MSTTRPPHDAQTLLDLAARTRIEAAERRLDGTNGYNHLMGAIDEILVHLLGAERFAIVAPDRRTPRVLHSRGIDAAQANAMLETGGGGTTATVPLVVAGRLLVTVVIFGFRGAKQRLDSTDRRILSVIAHRGAMALQHARNAAERPTKRVPSRVPKVG